MNWSERHINWLFANKTTVALVMTVFMVIAVWKLPSLKVSGTLTGFNVPLNTLFEDAQAFDSLFGGTRNRVFFSITPKEKDGYKALTACLTIEQEIRESNPKVRITSPRKYIRAMNSLLDPRHKLDTKGMLTKIASHPKLGKLISNDRRSFLMILDFQDGRVPTKALQAIKRKLHPYIQATHFFGLVPLEKAIEASIRHDILIISLAIVLCFGAYVFWVYRSFSAIAYTAVSMGCAILVTLCLYPLLNLQITVITVLALPIVLVLSLSDSIHLLSGLITTKDHKSVMAQFVVPSFLSSLTTSVAFFTFYFNDSPNIQSLGLITGIAVLMEFFVSYGVATLCFSFVKVTKRTPSWLVNISQWIQHFKPVISYVLILAVVSSFFFISRLKFDSKTDDFFPDHHEVTQDHAFINKNYHAQISCHVWFENRNHSREGEFEDAVAQHLQKMRSHAAVIDVSRSEHSTIQPTAAKKNKVPLVHVEFHFSQPSKILSFYHDAKAKKWLNQKGIKVHLYSQFLLLDYLNRQVAQSLFLSLLTSGSAIILMLLLITRSVKQALVGFIPNLVPLSIAVLVFVLFDFRLNLLTAITSIVCLGLLDDDTIHILYRKYIRKENPNELTASILNTALLLAIGFGLFMFSDFYPTRVFGGISALVFVFGIVGELTLFQWILEKMNTKNSMKQ